MTITGRSYTHTELWNCVEAQIDAANKQPRGAFYFHMAGMLFALLTYEAYLNTIGAIVDPEAWKNEKDFFRQANYSGLDGKLKRICEVTGIPRIDKSQNPYQTVERLANLRDFLAHGKIDEYSLKQPYMRENEWSIFHGKLNKEITPENTERAYQNVEKTIRTIHKSFEQIGELKDKWWVKADPLKGFPESAEFHTEIRNSGDSIPI